MPDTSNSGQRRHFFSIEDPSREINTSQSFGVLNKSLDSTKIQDHITERGAGLGKLASSMPTAMARLFIFDSALKQVNSYQSQDPIGGQIGVIDPSKSNPELEPTPYHDLVGEMLDMLEFIYEYGDKDEFHVHRWDLSTQVKYLKASPDIAHQRLADALQSSMTLTGIANDPIYLFLWKDDVIGGSSPISLVYTSANLRNKIKSGQFKGQGGNVLFADEACPLHKRGKNFQEYVYRLWQVYMRGLGNPLSTYIRDSAANYADPSMIRAIMRSANKFQRAKPLTTQGVPIIIAGVQLLVSDHTININKTTTDYMLAPTVDIYKHSNPTIPTPLALTPQGVKGLTYAADREWNPGVDIIPEVLPDIANRTLPGLEVKYPYLTTQDFLEDRIIEVSYNINRKKFFTGCKKNISFLLPLKKEFFEYFTIEDLFKVDPMSGEVKYSDMFTMEFNENTESVIVKLTLPLSSGQYLTFYKKYDVKEGSLEKLNCYDGSDTFDIAFFPFYQLVPDNGNNVYNVMIGATADGISTSYWRQDSTNGLEKVDSNTNHRLTKGQYSSLLTDHVRVNGTFSIMELSVNNKGLETKSVLLPIFTQVTSDTTMSTNQFTFAVDFGTTNTHLAYTAEPKGTPIGLSNVKPFNYNIIDTQLVMLNDEQGVAEFGAFTTAVKRELVPFVIHKDGDVKFPIRTSTYQIFGTPAQLELFANTNIGFNYGSDISNSKHYRTNIKWERADGLARQRMAAFFEQLLWMMKNKSALNDCTDTFKVLVTYPISMGEDDKQRFDQAWKDAVGKIKCNVKIKNLTESIAPYYAVVSKHTYGSPFVNIDIGGGTTDILYVNPETDEARVYSAFFAANDLWNDGLDATLRSAKENGFVSFYKAVRLDKLGDRTAEVKKVIENAASSADIISYLFANDKWTGLTDAIESSDIMKQLAVVHFCAIIFYVAYALHMSEVEPPVYLTFSGMGSKYIKLINISDSQISKLVNVIFHYAGSPEVFDNEMLVDAKVSVSFHPDPKEITATGALISEMYPKTLYPDENILHGFTDENPEITFRIKHLSDTVITGVQEFFKNFINLFRQSAMEDTLSDMRCPVAPEVIALFEKSASSSFKQAKNNSIQGVDTSRKLREPMFFWTLKGALYLIGKELAPKAIKKFNKEEE